MESLRVGDKQAAAVQKTPHRVALSDIEAAVDRVELHNPNFCPELTVCYVRLKNGFVVIGKSAPADPANYDAELGAKFAREDAVRQIWPLMGYALRDKLRE